MTQIIIIAAINFLSSVELHLIQNKSLLSLLASRRSIYKVFA